MEDLPWAHQPLLLALAGLFAAISPDPSHAPQLQPLPSSSSSSSAPTRGPRIGGSGGGGGGGGSDPVVVPFLTEGVTVVDETEELFGGVDAVTGDTGVQGGGGGVGVAIRDAAETLAPALLRYPPPAPAIGAGGGGGADAAGTGGTAGGSGARRRPDWEEELAAAAVVELILVEHGRVLEGMRAEQKRR